MIERDENAPRRRWRFHHSYTAGFWGVAYGHEPNREPGGGVKYSQQFIHLGRKVWVFRRYDRYGHD